MSDRSTVSPRIAALQVGLCAFWGLGQLATKVGNEGISPVFQAGLRSVGATLLILLWVAARRIPLDWRDGTGWLGVGIGILFSLEFVCLFQGLALTGAARATMLLYTAPFFVALGAHWLVPNDKLSPPKLLGLLLACAGVWLAFQDRLAGADRAALIGDLLCLAAGFFWAMTTIMVKATRLRSVEPEKNLLYQLAVSALVLLVVSNLLGEVGFMSPTPRVWLAFGYQVVIIASVSYLTWFFLVARYKASALSAFTFLTPVFGVIFAWVILGEPISGSVILALLLIAAGIVLVNRS